MLAMADRHGRVWASIPGLANRARIPVEDCRQAIYTFLSPDLDSRTPDNEGRRIEAIDGGWRLLNHEKYRSIRDEETTKEAKRKYINARRARERNSSQETNIANDDNSRSTLSTVDRCRDNAEAEAEAEAVQSIKSNSKTTTRRAKGNGADNSFTLPADIDPILWAEFLEMRQRIRKPATNRAKWLIVGKLANLEMQGNNPRKVLQQSIRNSWQDVFALRSDK
jgi:hypothetical protein